MNSAADPLHCPACNYDLRGLAVGNERCSECGCMLDAEFAKKLEKANAIFRRRKIAFIAFLVLPFVVQTVLFSLERSAWNASKLALKDQLDKVLLSTVVWMILLLMYALSSPFERPQVSRLILRGLTIVAAGVVWFIVATVGGCMFSRAFVPNTRGIF